jgi:PAS domain S-box-containing protein
MPLQPKVDFQLLFESAPGLYLILLPDFTIVAVSDAYLDATMTKRAEILGRGLFEVFPDNPDDANATGVSNLRASLNHVIKNHEPHIMAIQKYDIRRPDGSFEERFWSPQNKPVFNSKKEIAYLIHRVEDVTEYARLRKEEEKKSKINDELHERVEEMEIVVFKRVEEIESVNKQLLEEVAKKKTKEEELSRANNFLNVILENIPNMIFVKDAKELRFMQFNKAGEQLLGFSKDELLGKNDYDFFSREQADFFIQKDREVLKKGVLLDIAEEPINTKRGERWLHTKKIPLGDKNNPDYLLGISEDITEKKRLEDDLKKSNRRFITIFDMSPVPICITGVEDGKMRYVNNSFLKSFKFPNINYVIGKTAAELKMLSSGERESEIKKIKEKEHGATGTRELKLNMSGELRDVLASSEIMEIDGVTCAATALADITELKQTQIQLENVNKELEAFSYSVSHDLRAPLRAVDGYAKMLEEDFGNILNDEGKRLISVIQYNAQKMGILIDDLLALSRLGRKETSKTEINMVELTEAAIIELNKSISHKAKISVGDLHKINADYGLINQVMINYISNAIKYSSKKEKPQIKINSEIKNNELIFSINDNGVGFDMRYNDKLFGVFQRLHRMEEFEGTGVGLAIVKRIITKHGGKVWAEAEVDKGATFYFSLTNY